MLIESSDPWSIVNFYVPKTPVAHPNIPLSFASKIISHVISHAENYALNSCLISSKLNNIGLHFFILIFLHSYKL